MDKRLNVTIPLVFPVQLPDRMLTDVTMRRPIMKDMKGRKGLGMDLAADMGLIGDLCGLLPEELELMDTCDYEKLQTQLLRFRGVAASEDGAADGFTVGTAL